jgi:dTDP-4-amino-4,6-dideoxygalactose transaminase
MNVPFLDLTIRDKDTRAQIDRALLDAVENAAFIGGAQVRNFHEEFGRFCGGGECVSVANGTDALILALRALGVGPGDEVITVPFTFIATAEAITHVGATVKFVDINPRTYNIDTTKIEAAITPNTKAILPVHLFGQPADMDPILDIAKRKSLFVIEDAAQAHGSEYKGRRVGVLGDVACFSFYPTKNLGGFGDGGAVVSNNGPLLKRLAQLADHGRSDRYLHAVEGVNSRLDAMQAAVLRIKLRQLDRQNERRRQIAARYNAAIAQQSFITPPHVDPSTTPVFHLYTVESSHRERLADYLKENDVACGVYYPIPLHLQPAYAYLKLGRGSFPASERAAERILSLPMYGDMPDEHVERVCDLLKRFSPNVGG